MAIFKKINKPSFVFLHRPPVACRFPPSFVATCIIIYFPFLILKKSYTAGKMLPLKKMISLEDIMTFITVEIVSAAIIFYFKYFIELYSEYRSIY